VRKILEKKRAREKREGVGHGAVLKLERKDVFFRGQKDSPGKKRALRGGEKKKVCDRTGPVKQGARKKDYLRSWYKGTQKKYEEGGGGGRVTTRVEGRAQERAKSLRRSCGMNQ